MSATTYSVRKLNPGTGELSGNTNQNILAGIQECRHERLEVAFITIQANKVAQGDSVLFDKLPSKKILHVRAVATDGSAFGVEYVGGSKIVTNGAVNLVLANGAQAKEINVMVMYKKGQGFTMNVAAPATGTNYTGATAGTTTTHSGEVLKITYAAGE